MLNRLHLFDISEAHALSPKYWMSVKEVFLAWLPKPNLHGRIYGVFWNRYATPAMV